VTGAIRIAANEAKNRARVPVDEAMTYIVYDTRPRLALLLTAG
jgi:hypothetical protein